MIIAWTGKQLTLNDWYAGKHWSARHKNKSDWHLFFGKLLMVSRRSIPKPKEDEKLTYELTLTYRSNIDPSNTIAMVKVFEDTMQSMGIVKGDDKRFCKGIHLVPCDDFKPTQYQIEVDFTIVEEAKTRRQKSQTD